MWRESCFKNVPELSLDEAKKLLDECFEIGVRYIDFTGGEPTLYPHLTEVIEYAKKLGIKTEVTSNCISQASRHQKALLDVAKNVDKFNISLDTTSNSVYSSVRGVNACEQVKKKINDISSLRSPKIMTVVSDSNIADLDKMILFAQQNHSTIYLSPVFPYIDSDRKYVPTKYTKEIVSKIFEPYTIVLLHFMEFLNNSDCNMPPPCSANKMTITIAPNGNIVLPCYHQIKEHIKWDKPLKELIKTDKFLSYQAKTALMSCCKGCRVLPYMGISFNYQLDNYFLLQSYSEKLNHFKRDIWNDFYDRFNLNNQHLHQQLTQMVQIINSLTETPSNNQFYAFERTNEGYKTTVYKNILTNEEFEKDMAVCDCWQLECVPHQFFDFVNKHLFLKIKEKIKQKEKPQEDYFSFLQDALEFQIRWWKFFICKYMNVSQSCDLSSEKNWLLNYLNKGINLLALESKTQINKQIAQHFKE